MVHRHRLRTMLLLGCYMAPVTGAWAESSPQPAQPAQNVQTSPAPVAEIAPSNAPSEQPGNDIIVTGTRTTGLRAADSASPIQLLGRDELKRVGQTDLVQALAQILPSVQAQSFGGDQTAFHPSIRLRGISPNDTLVLLDGKRRHGTANIVVNTNIFTGNAAPDIGLIPEDAIDHVEVLQDGAAAQYGTDAIAGVINFILKKNNSGLQINATGGHYINQGGATYDIMGNIGIAPFKNAFLNVTLERKFKDFSFRGDVDPRVVNNGVPGNQGAGIIAAYPGVLTFPNYPYVNQITGDPKIQQFNSLYNAGYQLSDSVEAYSNGTYSHLVGRAYENYRPPNVVVGKSPTDIPFPSGFAPQEITTETDYAVTGGVRGMTHDIHWDLSSTFGRNINLVQVVQSSNAALYYDTSTPTSAGFSPTSFHVGDFLGSQWSNTLDLSRGFDVGLSAPINVAAGLEYRRDTYQLRAGDPAGYYTGAGVKQGGVQSFFGYSPAQASNNQRTDFSEFLDVSLKPVTQLLLDAAVRHEHYSDFGDTTVGKITGRYDISSAFAVRGTASTGFRAPTLAEEFYQGININVASLSAVLAPNSIGAKSLGIAGLRPEKSLNFSAGVVAHPFPRLTVTLDAYSIRLKDRIVQSGGFIGLSSTAGTPLSPAVLAAYTAAGISYSAVANNIMAGQTGSIQIVSFVNGLTTVTDGVDFVTTYNSDLGRIGKVDWSLNANYNDTKVNKLNAPPSNVNQNVQLVDQAARSLITTSTPKVRVTGAALWTLSRFSLNLRESFYGSSYVYERDLLIGSQFDKIPINHAFITDAELSYRPTGSVRLAIGANNLFNKYPNTYPTYFRNEQFSLKSPSVNYEIKYPNFSPYGINGGFYYGRVTLTL